VERKITLSPYSSKIAQADRIVAQNRMTREEIITKGRLAAAVVMLLVAVVSYEAFR
jgi:hypothetical protein